MAIYYSMMLAWVVYAISFFLEDFVKNRKTREKDSIEQRIKVQMYDYVRKLSFITAITYTSFVLLAIGLQLVCESIQGEVMAAVFLKPVLFLYKFYEHFKSGWEIFVWLLFVVVIFVTNWRNTEVSLQKVLRRVEEKYRTGEIDTLREDEVDQIYRGNLEALRKQIEAFDKREYLKKEQYEEAERKKEALRNELRSLYEHMRYRNYVRQVELELDRVSALSKPKGLLGSLILFFTSVGMYSSVKGVRKVLTIAANFILVLSLLGVQVIQFGGAMRSNCVALENIIVKAKLAKLDEKWEADLVNSGSQSESLSKEEDELLDQFCRAVEIGAHSFSLDQFDSIKSFEYLNAYVRTAVLNSYSTARQSLGDPSAYKLSGPFRNENYRRGEQRIFEKIVNSADTRRPTSQSGNYIKDEVEKVIRNQSAGSRRRVFEKFRHYVESFGRPLSTEQAGAFLYDEAISGLTEANSKELFGEGDIFSELGANGFTAAQEELFNASMKLRSKEIVSAVLIGQIDEINASYAKVYNSGSEVINEDMRRMQQSVGDNELLQNKVLQNLKNNPPTLVFEGVMKHDIAEIKQTVEWTSTNLTNALILQYGGDLDLENIDAQKAKIEIGLQSEFYQGFISYEDCFPNCFNGKKHTTMFELLSALGVIKQETGSLFANAFNYLNLVGNRRIGGVLIGRPPSSENVLAIDDLGWTNEGDQINLYLLHKGRTTIIGPFDRANVAQALAYASDGRPVAATMVSASNFLPLKVLVSPALANTKLGCQVIELDRFVDTYTRLSDVGDYLALQSYADRLYNYSACYVGAKRNETDSIRLQLERLAAEYKQSLPENYDSLRHKLDMGRVISDVTLCALAAKPDYYNQDLVKILCLGLNSPHCDSYEALADFVEANLNANLLKEDLLLTRGEIWSGVREKSYVLDDSLNFLKVNYDQPFAILDFIEQVAFNKTEYCRADIHPESDSQPWEFTFLKKNNVLEKLLTPHLRSAKNQSIIKSALQFVVLQRLFRTALSGKFGDKFPLLKLVQLENECLPGCSFIYTPTWSRGIDTDLLNDNPVLDYYKMLGITESFNLNPCD